MDKPIPTEFVTVKNFRQLALQMANLIDAGYIPYVDTDGSKYSDYSNFVFVKGSERVVFLFDFTKKAF